MHPTSIIRGAVIAGSLATVGLTGLSTLLFDSPSADNALTETQMVYAAPRPVRDWALERADGAAFSERDLVGRWSVVFVGYTRCPDVCPTTLHALSQSLGGLDVQALFLSVDPVRDIDLATYVSSFHPDLDGLTGTPDAIRHAVDNLGASFAPSDTQPGLIDHSTSLFVIDPTANVVGAVLRPTRPDVVHEDLRAFLQRPATLAAALWMPPHPTGFAGVVYGTIETQLDRPTWISGVRSPDVDDIALHETVVTAGVAKMVERRRVLLERDRGLLLEPGGLHLMLGGEPRADAPLVEWIFDDGTAALVRATPRAR